MSVGAGTMHPMPWESVKSECVVKRCSEQATHLWDAYLVCGFHATALSEGEPYAIEDMNVLPMNLLMGQDMPPEVVSVQLHQSMKSTPVAVLQVGHDGVHERDITLRISLAQARGLVFMLERWDTQPDSQPE